MHIKEVYYKYKDMSLKTMAETLFGEFKAQEKLDTEAEIFQEPK